MQGISITNNIVVNKIFRKLTRLILLTALIMGGTSIMANEFSMTQAKDFFTQTNTVSAKLSPNGKNIALINGSGDRQKLVLVNTKNRKRSDLLKLKEFTKRKSNLRAIRWIDNQHIAVQFSEIKKGVEDLLDTRNVQYILIIKLPKMADEKAVIYSVKTKGWLVNPLPNQAGVFLYAKSGIYSKVYRIYVNRLNKHRQKLSRLTRKDGGQFVKSNEVASIAGVASRWFFDDNGLPTAVLNFSRDGNLHLNSYIAKQDHQDIGEKKNNQRHSQADNAAKEKNIVATDKNATVQDFKAKGEETTVELKVWDFDKIAKQRENNETIRLIMPVAAGEDENTFYCLDFEEEFERSVYKVNYKTNSQELVFEADSFKIIDLIISPKSHKLIGVKVLKDAGVRNVYLDGNQFDEHINQPANMMSEVGISENKKISLLYREGHNQPGRYLLRNNRSKKEFLIASNYPKLVNKLTSKLIEKTVEVESLDIPYLLTLPKRKANSKPSPLIVIPHGGPIGVFDDRYFDLKTQYLAANGYAVLRVNFRGSNGHSTKLKEAGKRQWGKLMLEDIYQATLATVKRADVDLNRVCIFGLSYGGYAATMLTIEYPELFKCAVNVAGVSDVNLYLNNPKRSTAQEKWLNEYVGDTVGDYQGNKHISPVYRIRELNNPLLIIHGAKDETVDIEHAYRLKMMLEKYNKPFDWYIFPEGQHSFGNYEDQQLLFSKVKSFIDQQLL
jgi:dipeptidyl aminopeptidase/acylaminoacyl peptidase